jgi:hypothetical protein
MNYWSDTCAYQQSKQDLTVQRHGLRALGDDRIYVDDGLTGTNREVGCAASSQS